VGAYSAAIFHVMTHAFFKGLLFLAAGSVIHAMAGEQDITKMGGLGKKMRITYITFFIACLAIAGIPPFSGFFSKDEILNASFASSPILYILGVGASMLTAFYMFRLLSLTFAGKFRGSSEQENKIHESSKVMTIPLIILAILSAIGGFVGIPEAFGKGGNKIGDFLSPVFSRSQQILGGHANSHQTEIILMAATAVLSIVVSVWAWNKYKNAVNFAFAKNAFGRAVENKFYVDELYDFLFVKPYRTLGHFLNNIVDKKGIDGIVNGVGRTVNYGSRQLRLLQSGQVGSYLLLMVVGMLLLFIIQFFSK
jgi:NADH-quinone oxidoreductase subunit L